MDALIGLVVLLLTVALTGGPLLALLGFIRVSRLARESAKLEQRLRMVERRLGALASPAAETAATRADTVASTHLGSERPATPEPTAAAPAAAPPAGAARTEARMPPTAPVRSAPAQPPPGDAGDLVERQNGDPATPPPMSEPPPGARAETSPETAAGARPGPARGAPSGPPTDAPPTSPRAPGSRPPRLPPKPPRALIPGSFDWESLLGLKGAAILGGITLVISAMFLAKMAYDSGLFTPALRVAVMVAAGVGALVWAERSLRRGYEITANAVSGAGIAILYVALFAARSLFDLIPVGPTFALMALVTVVAGVLSIRYDAVFTALLGLLGGFATPIVVSTGVDRPIGLFSYILLLNLGLMVVALRRGWHTLVLLALAGTLIIEVGWFDRFGSPEKLLIGVVAFILFGLLYLALPFLGERSEQEPSHQVLWASAIGGVAPLGFAIWIAADAGYSAEWPLIFGFVGLINVALASVALLRHRASLLLAGSVATAWTLPLWAAQGLTSEALWGPTLAAIALAFILNAPPRLATRFGSLAAPTDPSEDRSAGSAPPATAVHDGRSLLEAAGLLGLAGLGMFGAVLATGPTGTPPWAFVVLLASLFVLMAERSGAERIRGAFPVVAFGIATLIGSWFVVHVSAETLLRDLAFPLLFLLALSVLVTSRTSRFGFRASDEAAVLAAAVVSALVLFSTLQSPPLRTDHLALFASAAIVSFLAVASAVRGASTLVLPVTLAGTVMFAGAWHTAVFTPSDTVLTLLIYGSFYLAFLGLPFAVPSPVTARWRERPAPWWTSAMSGPAYFLLFYDATRQRWGPDWIGALPLVLAALSLIALRRVGATFPAGERDSVEGRRRLAKLALFAALALGFVAVTIPLQLDRQWITVGWALEGAAVWWLFGRLPHPGLKMFGALLLGAAGVRLLVNPAVLTYYERGLPVFNWLLYTYGVAALCALVGARWLRAAEDGEDPPRRTVIPEAASVLGVLLVFWLINLEVADFFSPGRYIELTVERSLARDLTLSVAWAAYAMTLLGVGVVRGLRPLRLLALGFLLLTVLKVFLYDLSQLTGVYRVLSFLGLGLSLIAVSLVYQRFVVPREEKS